MRTIVVAAIALVLVAFACIQFASDAFSASAAAPGSVPSRVPIRLALDIYRTLGRAAPAAYVEATLAQYELEHGDTDAAQRDAVRLPPIAVRNELLGQIALARGDRVLALEYFFAAPDIAALGREVLRVARTDPAAAYAFERHVSDRLVTLQTHPDAVAETHWTMSQLAAEAAHRLSPGSVAQTTWLRRALGDGIAAVQLSPLSEKYLLQVAALQLALGNPDAARRWYHRVLGVDPGSTDALAGLRSAARARARARPQ
jgi:tetratricopeptide (TPR) repeat protein